MDAKGRISKWICLTPQKYWGKTGKSTSPKNHRPSISDSCNPASLKIMLLAAASSICKWEREGQREWKEDGNGKGKGSWERTYKVKNKMQRKRQEMKRKQKPKENISSDSPWSLSGCGGAPFTTGCRKVGKSQRFHCHLSGPISPRCSRDMDSTSERCHKYSHYRFINKEQLLAKKLGVLKGYFLILCLFHPMAHLTTSGLRLYQK